MFKKGQFFVSVTSVELISFFSAKTEADLHNINYIAISPIAEQQPRETLAISYIKRATTYIQAITFLNCKIIACGMA